MLFVFPLKLDKFGFHNTCPDIIYYMPWVKYITQNHGVTFKNTAFTRHITRHIKVESIAPRIRFTGIIPHLLFHFIALTLKFLEVFF